MFNGFSVLFSCFFILTTSSLKLIYFFFLFYIIYIHTIQRVLSFNLFLFPWWKQTHFMIPDMFISYYYLFDIYIYLFEYRIILYLLCYILSIFYCFNCSDLPISLSLSIVSSKFLCFCLFPRAAHCICRHAIYLSYISSYSSPMLILF
jgi:hypothetical protein